MQAAFRQPFPPVLPDPGPSAAQGERPGFIPDGLAAPVAGAQQTSPPRGDDKSQFCQHFVEGDEDNDDEGETRCICGETPDDHDGIMIQCEDCHCWQHGICVGIPDVDSCPERYYCETCRPEQHPYKLPSKPKARNRRNGSQAGPAAAAASTTNGPRKRRSPSEDQDQSSATEPAENHATARPRCRAANPGPARKRSQRRGSGSKAAENDAPAISNAVATTSTSDEPGALKLPFPGSGSTSQRGPRRNSSSKSPKKSPPSLTSAVQAAEVEVVATSDHADSLLDSAMAKSTAQAACPSKEVCPGGKRKARSVSVSPVKETKSSVSLAGRLDEGGLPAHALPLAMPAAAGGTKRRRLARTVVVRTEGEESTGVVPGAPADSAKKEEEMKPTSGAPGICRRPRVSPRASASEASPVGEPAVPPACRGRGGRGRLGKRGSPAKRGGRVAGSVASQNIMPPAISIPAPAGGRWPGATGSTFAVASSRSSSAAAPASAASSAGFAAMAGHPYYRHLGDLVKIRSRPRNPHSRTSLAEMNRRAKLMLDWITRLQVERAEKQAQKDRAEKEEPVLERRKGPTGTGEGTARCRETAAGGPTPLPLPRQPALPAALDPRMTPPLALAEPSLARSIASGADSSSYAAADGASSLAAAVKASCEKTLELMDSLSRDVVKFQKRFPIKGRGG